jgi:hypothetical protein
MHRAQNKAPPRGLDGPARHDQESGNDYANDSQIASAVRDTKDGPWCWQNKAALKTITPSFAESKQAASARSVYVALTEIASDRGSETFSVTKAEIATRSGTSVKTVERLCKGFEELGLLAINATTREVATTGVIKAPNTYTLLTLRHCDASTLRHGGKPTSVTHKERKGEETNKESLSRNAHARPLTPEQQRQFEQLQTAVTGLTSEDAIERLKQLLDGVNVKWHRADYLTYCHRKHARPTMRGLLRRLVQAEQELQPAKATKPKRNADYEARLRQSEEEGRAELGIT